MVKLPGPKGYSIKDSRFFRLRTKKKLAKLLRVSQPTLAEISKRDDLYVRRWKHKKDDKWLKEPPLAHEADDFRPIDIPDQRLKSMQARIADLMSRITAPDWLFSPVKGRSYVDNAAHHKGSKAFWLLDIANYFPSCSAKKVAHLFLKKFECSEDVTAILVHIVTVADKETGLVGLPQGSPCSPILAFFSNLDMWCEIEAVVERAGLRHSVYADDITISGSMVPKSAVWEIKKAVHKHGLRIKSSKEHSLIDVPADITGVIVVGEKTKLPNRQLLKLFELKLERQVAIRRDHRRMLDNRIAGRIAQRRQVEQL